MPQKPAYDMAALVRHVKAVDDQRLLALINTKLFNSPVPSATALRAYRTLVTALHLDTPSADT